MVGYYVFIGIGEVVLMVLIVYLIKVRFFEIEGVFV